MAFNTQPIEHMYQPGSAQAPEAIPFQFLAPDDLIVELLPASGGAVVTLVLGGDFNITGSGPAGTAAITATANYPESDRFLVRRRTEIKQEAIITPHAPVPSRDIERQFDRMAMVGQETRGAIEDLNSRALLFPRGTVVPLMPPLADLRGQFLSLNADDRWIGLPGTGNDAALRAALASSTAGLGAALVARERGGSVETSLLEIETRSAASIALGQLHRFMSKIVSESADANLGIATDSTGDTLTEWIGLWMNLRFKLRYARWSIVIHFWDAAGDVDYLDGVPLQVGTGPRTLHLWVGAVAGSLANHFAGSRFEVAFGTRNLDLFMPSYGHNADIYDIGGGFEASRPQRQRSWFAPLADRLAKRLPDLPVVMIGQNPTWRSNGTNEAGTDDGFMRARLDILRPFAARRGWGFINVHDAFLQSPLGLPTLVPDKTHPGSADGANQGSLLWASVVDAAMQASIAAQDAGGSIAPVLLKAWRSFADFNTWTTVAGNITLTQQTGAGRFDTRPDAATATITNIAGQGFMYIDPFTAADLPALRGKPVTFGIWMRVPATAEVSAGRIEIVDDGVTEFSPGPVRGDGFALFTVTKVISTNPAAALPRIAVYAAEGARNPASFIDLDRASISLGTDAVDPITVEAPIVAPPLPPFRGALVKKNADQTTANYVGGANVAWDAEAYDTDAFHDNAVNNSRITIPAAFNGKRVVLRAQVRYTNGTTGEFAALSINKNGGGYDGQAYLVISNTTGVGSLQVSTPPIVVATNDFFEANFQIQTDNSITVAASLSWFSIEIVE